MHHGWPTTIAQVLRLRSISIGSHRLGGHSFEFMSQTYMDKLKTQISESPLYLCTYTDNKVAPILLVPALYNKMFNRTWYNRSLRMPYITHILPQYLRFCYSFCLTAQPRIINISNVCSTPYSLTVIIRIREICTWSKTMANLTILSCRSATCF